MGIKHEKVAVSRDKGTAADWNANHVIDGNINYNQYSNLNYRVENRTDWPAGPVAGQIIFRTDLNKLYIWNENDWITFVSPATIVVAADGSGHTTNIQEGINLLPEKGGVVYIKEGIYYLNNTIEINKDFVSIRGSGRNTILYRNLDGVSGINILNRNCIIENLKIEGNNGSGIIINNGECVINNVMIVAGKGKGILVSNSGNTNILFCYIIIPKEEGIFIESSAHINLTNNIITGTSNGIYVSIDSININILGNSINTPLFEGIKIEGRENIINSNSLKGSILSYGVYLTNNSDRNIITSNYILGNGAGEIQDLGTNNLISNNIIA